MGVVFSSKSTHSWSTRFENGVIYWGKSMRVFGKYADGKVYDETGNLVATYRNNSLQATNACDIKLIVENDCIYCNGKVLARFLGDTEGACAAAYLSLKHLREDVWSLSDLWKMFNEHVPSFIKVLIGLVLLVTGYNLFQLPAVIAYLLEEEAGVLLLLVWGAAFLYAFLQAKDPLIIEARHVFNWLWDSFLPFLHASWVTVVIMCIYAILKGFFSLTYVAGIIQLLPNVAIPLVLPLYSITLCKSLFLLSRRKQ